MRFVTIFSILCFLGGPLAAQSKPSLDSNVVLQVTIAGNQQEFHIGETIPLSLSFKTTVKGAYEVNMAQYDRGGRMNYERFVVSPSDGAVDPLPTYNGSMGGLTSYQFLSPEPWTIKLNLNEWIRFTQPGEYRLVVTSNRVSAKDRSNPLGASPVTARSNEIVLKIVPANAAWQRQVYDEAVAVLDARAPTQREQMEKYTASRRQAIETLRFLGTADATRELAKRMRGEDSGGLDYLCMLGLISSPERAVARSALEEALADPDHPIDSNFLYTLRMLNSEPGIGNANWREENQRAVEQLVAALPVKRGNALSVSLATALAQAWDLAALPKETTDKLIGQLTSMFDQLPLKEQNTLLTFRWNKIASPALLPILRRYAQSYRDFPEMRDENAYNSLSLSGSALRHWYELDPAGARPAIITEITRPRPRFGVSVLGILPDETLPEVDFALAEHFVASEDLDGSSNLASLIARYATSAILPQITEKLDPQIGKLACAIQNPILAYVLRTSPALARPRIEKAISTRGKNFSACNHDLFQIVSEIHYDQVLEEIGIRSLDDPDPQIAGTAATMLGKFGSPAAESALWRRYQSWSAQQVGHESELELMFADRLDDRIYQLGLGVNLMQALVTGKSWLSDKSKLQRLSQVTQVRRLRQDLDRCLKMWEDQPLTISVNNNSWPSRFEARVAQYEFHSLDDLKEKLSQFPSGTKFLLFTSATESSANGETVAALRAFLTAHGMSVAEERPAH